MPLTDDHHMLSATHRTDDALHETYRLTDGDVQAGLVHIAHADKALQDEHTVHQLQARAYWHVGIGMAMSMLGFRV